MQGKEKFEAEEAHTHDALYCLLKRARTWEKEVVCASPTYRMGARLLFGAPVSSTVTLKSNLASGESGEGVVSEAVVP